MGGSGDGSVIDIEPKGVELGKADGKGLEVDGGSCGVVAVHPVEAGFAIHGGYEREGAEGAQQVVALGQQTEVFAGVALWKVNADTGMGCQLGAEKILVDSSIAADIDAATAGGQLLEGAVQVNDEFVVGEDEFAVAPSAVVASPHMYADVDGGFSTRLLLHVGVYVAADVWTEGKELANVGQVFEEEVEVADTPSLDHGVAGLEQLPFLGGGVFVEAVVADDGYEPQAGRVLACQVAEPVVVAGAADVEVGVFVGEAHGHAAAVVFTRPCIDMCELQQVVAHLTFIANEEHGGKSTTNFGIMLVFP